MQTASPPLPLPPLGREEGLGAGQRRALTLGVVGLHVAAGVALLQVPEVRQAAAEVAPVFVSWVAPERPKVEPPPPEPPKPQPVKPTPTKIVTAAPTPVAPTPSFVVPEQIEVPPPPSPPTPPVVVAEAAPPTPPAPPAQPKVIPASAVEYLHVAPPEYPRVSRRLGESGTVIVRVLIDEDGQVKTSQLSRSSGFARLDDAAVSAVRGWRFKPYTENGKPASGYAFIPVAFGLERAP